MTKEESAKFRRFQEQWDRGAFTGTQPLHMTDVPDDIPTKDDLQPLFAPAKKGKRSDDI